MPNSQKMDKEQFCKDLLPVLKKMHLPYKSKINDLVYTIENGFAEYLTYSPWINPGDSTIHKDSCQTKKYCKTVLHLLR